MSSVNRADFPLASEQFGHRFQRENLVEVLKCFTNVPGRLGFNGCADDITDHPAEQAAGEFFRLALGAQGHFYKAFLEE